MIASPRPRPRGPLRGGGARVRARVRSRCCSLRTLSPRRPPEGAVGQSRVPGPRGAGTGFGWQRLQKFLGPRAFKVGAGTSQQRLPLVGEAMPSGCTARFGAWGPRWKVQSDPAPRPLSGCRAGFACFRLCGRSCVGSANAGTGPLLSSYLAGDFRGSVADASPPCCGAEGGPLLGFTPPLPLDGALYCQQGLACSWHHPWFGAVRGRIRSGEPGPESLPPSLFSLRCPSSPHRYRGWPGAAVSRGSVGRRAFFPLEGPPARSTTPPPYRYRGWPGAAVSRGSVGRRAFFPARGPVGSRWRPCGL